MSGKRTTRDALRRSLDLQLFQEVLRWDAGVGLLGAVGAGVLAASDRTDSTGIIALSAAIIGVVVATVVGAAAVIAAFFDQPFLRRLAAINRKPGYFLAPLVFTALLGILGLFSAVIWFGVVNATEVVVVLAAAMTGLFGAWSLASLVPCLVILSELADIKALAAEIDDDALNE